MSEPRQPHDPERQPKIVNGLEVPDLDRDREVLRLGLCDPREVFTPEQLAKLDEDLSVLRDQRAAPPNDVWLD